MKSTHGRKTSSVVGLLCLLASLCVAQVATTREGILNDVRERARAHAESAAPKDSKLVMDLYASNQAGVTPQEILDVYDREYTKAKRHQEVTDWKPKAGWVIAAALFLALIFLDRLKAALSQFLTFLGGKLFEFFAGFSVFYRLPLKRYYMQMVERHSKLKIPFRPERPLDLASVFVPLKVVNSTEQSESYDAYAFISGRAKLVVTGSPGAGKSILMRHIALTSSKKYLSSKSDVKVPILIELNRLNSPTVTLRSELLRELSSKGFPKADRFLDRCLDRGSVLLLLDGFDEISASRRPDVVLQIRELSEQFSTVPLILSCRKQVYNGELNSVADKTLEIQDFTNQQIRRFLQSWSADMQAHGKSVQQLMSVLTERPTIMSLARNPLMLTIIAWLYTDTKITLPHSRTEFYQKATDLLLYDWKPDGNLYMKAPKRFVLADLALHLQDQADQAHQDRRSLELPAVLKFIVAMLPNLNLDSESAMPLLNEIVQRSGLLLAIDGGERYQFAHLTLQEYLAAVALRSDSKGLLDRFRKDQDAWREPVKLWCGFDEDATDFITSVYEIDPVTGFECLADAQRVRPVIVDRILGDMKQRLLSEQADTPVIKAFGAVASSLSDRGKAVFKWLRDRPEAQALEALSYTNMPNAAEVLAKLYTSVPVARKQLVRLQDLAVPSLLRLAEAGSGSAVDDLLSVGTPGAAEALVSLLWAKCDEEVRHRAGFAVASLFAMPEILESLSKITKPKDRILENRWVWQPFEEDGPNILTLIAGRVTMLLQNASIIPALPDVKLDPRLVIPVLVRDGKPLDHDRVSIRLMAPLSESQRAILKRTVEPQFEAGDSEAVARHDEQIHGIFGLITGDRNSQYLFERLPRAIQGELVRALYYSRAPTQEDWVNVFDFGHRQKWGGWRMWLAFGMTQTVSLWDIMHFFLKDHFTPFRIFATIVMLAFGVLVVIVVSDGGVEDEGDLRTIGTLVTGPFFFLTEEGFDWSSLEIKKISDIGRSALSFSALTVVVCWSPIWIVEWFYVLRQLMPIFMVSLGLCVFAGVIVSLYLWTRMLLQRSKNPLRALIFSLDPNKRPAVEPVVRPFLQPLQAPVGLEGRGQASEY